MKSQIVTKIVILLVGIVYSFQSHSADNLAAERERLAIVNSGKACASLLSYHSPVTNQSAQFEYKRKGLQLYFELEPLKSGHKNNQFELVRFHFRYQPQKLLPGSYFRRVLGDKPFEYTSDDIRRFTQNAIYLDHGQVLEFYLRLPEDKNKTVDEGPLIAIALKTGEVIGYPAGTDVDTSAQGALGGSLTAIKYFVRGMSIELQRAVVKPTGTWHVGRNVDEELLLLEVDDSI